LENSQGIVLEAGFYFRLVTTITLLTGTMLFNVAWRTNYSLEELAMAISVNYLRRNCC
jgi:hypothetical protein